MHNLLSNTVGWQFLSEPVWRWGIFVGVVMLFMVAWSGVLRHM